MLITDICLPTIAKVLYFLVKELHDINISVLRIIGQSKYQHKDILAFDN